MVHHGITPSMQKNVSHMQNIMHISSERLTILLDGTTLLVHILIGFTQSEMHFQLILVNFFFIPIVIVNLPKSFPRVVTADRTEENLALKVLGDPAIDNSRRING